MDESKAFWPGWQTVRRLGAGSFGAVYEIERDVMGEKEKAALKVISIPKDDSDIDELRSANYSDMDVTTYYEGILRSIVQEYSTMMKLKGNSHIVSCEDYSTERHADGIGWDIKIRMELLTPLTNVLDRMNDEREVLKLGIDMCRALTLCHGQKIMHRDIKPQNIFVSDSGDYKLGDFGIAKVANGTGRGTRTGTVKFMAPEVYRGEEYGFSVDLYSLGTVLYWLLNERRLPFLPMPPAAPTLVQEEEAAARRLSGEPLPDPVHASPFTAAVIRQACAFRPEERFQTAEAMAGALKAALTRCGGAFAADPVGEDTVNLFGGMPSRPAAPQADYQPMTGANSQPSLESAPPLGYRPISGADRQPSLEPTPPQEAAKSKKWIIPVAIGGGALLTLIILIIVLCATCASCAKKITPTVYTGRAAQTTPYDEPEVVETEPVTYIPEPEIVETTTEPETTTTVPETTVPKGVPGYLDGFVADSHYGKIYYHSDSALSFETNSNWKDIYTPGRVDTTEDIWGTMHACGIHLDGPNEGPYSVSYALNGGYTLFSGYFAPSSVTGAKSGQSKCVEIYGDGRLLYSSPYLTRDDAGVAFNVDVTGVDRLTLEWTTGTGSNDLCVIYDGYLE